MYLQTERNREIGSKTVQSIQTILKGYESDLKHDAVTVVDQKGHHYLDAGNPALGAISRTRAREEELGQKILEQLHWIKGVSVTVQLPLSPRSRRVPRAASGPGGHAPRPGRGTRPSPAVDGPQSPLEIDPEPGAGPTPAPVSVAPAAEPKPAGGGGQGTVWVKVPRNFYKRMIEKEPSLEVAAVMAHNEKDIRTAVELVVPRGEPWSVKIGSILDDTSEAGLLPSQVASPSRRPIPWWPLAGTAAAVAVTLMVAAYRAVVSRRPVPRRARGGPGPIPDRHRPGARARPVGAGPRAGPVQSRGRRRRPATLDRPGRARRMTRTEDRLAPPLAQAARSAGAGTLEDDPASESTPLRKAAILLVSLEGPWPRNCWPSSIGRPSRR